MEGIVYIVKNKRIGKAQRKAEKYRQRDFKRHRFKDRKEVSSKERNRE